MIKKIISGGQTGADRAALDVAIKLGIPHGGWIPKGRLTENGPLPEKYQLKETPTSSYHKRTERNVMISDGTLILSHGGLTGGSELTQQLAAKHQKPCLHIDLNNISEFEATLEICNWIKKNNIEELNVAGPRESRDPWIYEETMDVLDSVITLDIANTDVTDPISRLRENNFEFDKALPPLTVYEAVERLVSTLTFHDKTKIANTPEDKLEKLHFSFIMQIRNEFRIWGNDPLLESCRSLSGEDEIHPDHASMIIVQELWKRLQQENVLRVVK